ncbi:hypothetical protein MRX96_003284 [Rhipicephalus microplus]|uniref:Uncharacterized protein n=1 Tax=Rhipicephalus microplus TaxID=6941 RepID=A0A9J6EK18_RHIMP|nr:uncharacterized protein LOC119161796 [Rhipicephalus microplus]KAH8034469.1 hypothetical protein HPB51_024470 [Rhipicephalus microplus]
MPKELNKAAGDTLETSALSKAEVVATPAQTSLPGLKSLKRHLRKTYGDRSSEMVSRYFRSMLDLASYDNHTTFLMRCRTKQVVPHAYRIYCNNVKSTKQVVRILDEYTHKLMLSDLTYNRLRKVQVSTLIARLYEKLEKILSPDDFKSVVLLAKGKYESVFKATRDKQRAMFDDLLKERGIQETRRSALSG